MRHLQAALAQGGWYQGEIDGRYGPDTTQAVQAFQRERDLPASGIVDRNTWQHLLLSLDPQGIWATLSFPTPDMITFTPLLVSQPAPPPSPFWLLLMALIPLVGGGLTYLQHRWQAGRKR